MANLVGVALIVDDALRPAVRCVSLETWQALAILLIADDATLGVGAARGRNARLLRRRQDDLLAVVERIASVPVGARANRFVLEHLADGSSSAGVLARVDTPTLDTSLVGSALLGLDTLGPARGRPSVETGLARTDDSLLELTDRVRSTGVGVARISGLLGLWRDRF